MEDIVAKANEYWKRETNNGAKKPTLTTSQIRKFLTAVNSVANKVGIYKADNPTATELSDDLVAEIKYLQVPLVYQAGREIKTYKDKVTQRIERQSGPTEKFFSETNLMRMIDDIGDSIKAFERFAKYTEALVAYHKYYGGKEK